MPSRPDPGPRPPAFGHSVLDRAAERRGGAAALATDPRAGFYVVAGETVVMKTGGGLPAGRHEPCFAAPDLAGLGAAAETVFLGLCDGAPRFGVGLAAGAAAALAGRGELTLRELRPIAAEGLVAPEHVAPIAEAKALLNWHGRHRFCANCGAPTQVADGGWRRDCPDCGAQHFPRTDPVVIMLASRGDKCLLGRQARFPPQVWSCLAGFVEPGETIEEAARREILEEAGIVCGAVRYFASQPWPFPSSLMIGCHADALSEAIRIDYNELEDARWFDRDEAALMLRRQHPGGLMTPPPFAIAHHIIRAWLEPPVHG